MEQSVNGQGAERSGAAGCGGGLKRRRRRPEQPGPERPAPSVVQRAWSDWNDLSPHNL
ncbi:MAG: hypothetical protein J5801_03710 [Bacteroidales bacterium]|nr:hypothetical protein [Bacteroidales bacterium]